MTLSRLVPVAMTTIIASLVASCSSNLKGSKHDSGTDAPVTSIHDAGRDVAIDSSKDSRGDGPVALPQDSAPDVGHGPGGCSGHAPAPSEIPTSHRPTAVACTPTPYTQPDGGVTACTSEADCPFLVLRGPQICLHGQCSLDRCLTDADCKPNEACDCTGGPLPVRGLAVNTCVPANCHVDTDCGPNGYCSRSAEGTCGTAGYFCHGPNDTCVDETKDCGCGQTCRYMPTTGAFTCAPPGFCAG